MEGFFASLVWGAYTWRGLFSEFYGTLEQTFIINLIGEFPICLSEVPGVLEV